MKIEETEEITSVPSFLRKPRDSSEEPGSTENLHLLRNIFEKV